MTSFEVRMNKSLHSLIVSLLILIAGAPQVAHSAGLTCRTTFDSNYAQIIEKSPF